MKPNLYTISDPDLSFAPHEASIPVGDGSEVIDVTLIPYIEYPPKRTPEGIKEDNEWVLNEWKKHLPVVGKIDWEEQCNAWQELANRFMVMAQHALDNEQKLIDMIRNSNMEIKNDPRDN
jgi:hypothetical protein